MKETLLKFNMDVLVESKHLVKVKGQKPLTYANGVDNPGYDMYNMCTTIVNCFEKLEFEKVSGREAYEDHGGVFVGIRRFGDEILKVVVKVTVQLFDTYLPEKHMEKLKVTKWEGPRKTWYFQNGHIGGNGDDEKWVYRNIVMNNVVYPCKWEDDKYREMYEDATDALYDAVYRKVEEMGAKSFI